MGLADLDQQLERLRATTEQAGANLLELDRDATRRLLEVAALEGETAQRWHDANAGWPEAWTWFTKLTALVDDARTLRGTRSWLSPEKETRLRDLLTAPSMEVSRTDVPLLDRALAAPQQTTEHCTPDELLARLSEAFDRMRTLLSAVSLAWDELVPRVSGARAALDELATEAHGLDEELAPELARLRPRLDDLGRRLFADPLATGPDEVDAVEADVAALRRDLGAMDALRATIGERLARARSRLDEAREAVTNAEVAHRTVLVKIAHPAVPIPAAFPADLADRLADIEALTTRGRWRDARDELEQWDTRVEAVVTRALADATANRAPIDERDELRGRLSAYRAMAQRLDLLEDREIAAVHDAAHDALFTAPTDLAEAGELVRRYQQAVTARPPTEGPRR